MALNRAPVRSYSYSMIEEMEIETEYEYEYEYEHEHEYERSPAWFYSSSVCASRLSAVNESSSTIPASTR